FTGGIRLPSVSVSAGVPHSIWRTGQCTGSDLSIAHPLSTMQSGTTAGNHFKTTLEKDYGRWLPEDRKLWTLLGFAANLWCSGCFTLIRFSSAQACANLDLHRGFEGDSLRLQLTKSQKEVLHGPESRARIC